MYTLLKKGEKMSEPQSGLLYIVFCIKALYFHWKVNGPVWHMQYSITNIALLS